MPTTLERPGTLRKVPVKLLPYLSVVLPVPVSYQKDAPPIVDLWYFNNLSRSDVSLESIIT